MGIVVSILTKEVGQKPIGVSVEIRGSIYLGWEFCDKEGFVLAHVERRSKEGGSIATWQLTSPHFLTGGMTDKDPKITH